MLSALLLSLTLAPQETPAPPNVVVVLIDDLGYGDLGVELPGIPGRSDHRTPNIARLAREGLVLTNGYAAAPNCAPSRASLQTGRYTPRHGVLTVNSSKRGKAKHREIVPVTNTSVLADDEVTLAEMLARAGYTSAHVGKWHLGDDARTQGYVHNVGGFKAGHPKSYFAPYKNPHLDDGPNGEYLTTRLTDEAIGLLDRMEGPFLLHLAYYTVHTPLQAPVERVAERKEAGAGNAKYAAMVEALDHEMGRLLRALDEKGLAENTLIVFTSDNGGHTAVTNTDVLRGFKGTLDEGGVRVPWIVRWPRRVAPGVSDAAVHHVDLFPTIAALAGATPDPDVTLDGVDLTPLLVERGAAAPRDLYWHFPCYLEGKSDRFERFRTTPGGSFRSGDWKLVEYFHPETSTEPRLELYDLSSDPMESRDLAKAEGERVRSMYAAMRAWRASVGAEVPTEREPKYEPPATAEDDLVGFRELVRDPSLWRDVELAFENDRRLARAAASWTEAQHLAALRRYLLGATSAREARALRGALEVRPETTAKALIAMFGAETFRVELAREEVFGRATRLFGDAPPPRCVALLAPYLSSESVQVRVDATFTIAKVGTDEAILALEPVSADPTSREFGMMLVGLAYPTGEGRLAPDARPTLFALLRDAIPRMEDDVADAIRMMIEAQRERALELFRTDEHLNVDVPHLGDVLQAFVEAGVRIERARLLALIADVAVIDEDWPRWRALRPALRLLGRWEDASDRPLLERWMNADDEWVAEAAAIAYAATFGLEDGLDRVFEMDGADAPIEARRLNAVWMLDAEVQNGGFDQYWFNSSGDDWRTALDGLDAMGLEERAKIMRRAIARFGDDGPPVDRSKRQDRLAEITTGDESAFDAEDSAWYDCAEHVTAAMVRYMLEHREALGLE